MLQDRVHCSKGYHPNARQCVAPMMSSRRSLPDHVPSHDRALFIRACGRNVVYDANCLQRCVRQSNRAGVRVLSWRLVLRGRRVLALRLECCDRLAMARFAFKRATDAVGTLGTSPENRAVSAMRRCSAVWLLVECNRCSVYRLPYHMEGMVALAKHCQASVYVFVYV